MCFKNSNAAFTWCHKVRNKHSNNYWLSLWAVTSTPTAKIKKKSHAQKLELRSRSLDKLTGYLESAAACRYSTPSESNRNSRNYYEKIKSKQHKHSKPLLALVKLSHNVDTSTLGYPDTFWRHSYQNCSASNIPNPFNTSNGILQRSIVWFVLFKDIIWL